MNKQGFTLLEVMLFFAVSGLLALVAFVGLGPRLRNVRFTDAVRSLESTTQRQLSDFQSGVNLRDSSVSCLEGGVTGITIDIDPGAGGQSVGASEDCIINGRLAVFEENQVAFYPVVSLRKQQPTCTEHTHYGKIFCHKPHIIGLDATKQVSAYRNGAERSAPNENVKVLYMQDPAGTRTQLMQHTALAEMHNGTVQSVAVGDVSTEAISFCIALSGRVAQIEYTDSSLRPDVKFEECTI